MKRLLRLKYPKIDTLIIISLFAYVIFQDLGFKEFLQQFGSGNIFAVFIAGMMFSFGFSTPFAVGFFLTVSQPNILVAAMIGGSGALISDLFILKIVRISFLDEFKKIARTKTIKNLHKALDKKVSLSMQNYLTYTIAGIMIASPVPDELGISMLAGLTKLNAGKLAVISFFTNSIGIVVMLLIGKVI